MITGKNIARKTAAAVLALLMTACPAASFAVDGGVGVMNTKSTIEYGNGFAYTKGTYTNSTYGPEAAFELTTQPGTVIKPIVMSGDIYGGMTIQKAVETAQSQGYNVLGAVNSDFFTFSTGIPLGISVENGVYRSNPDGYPAVAFDAEGKATIVKKANVYISLTNNGSGGTGSSTADTTETGTTGGTDAASTDTQGTGDTQTGSEGTDGTADGSGTITTQSDSNHVTFVHFNKQRVDGNGMCLYDSSFGSSTKTSSSGWFVKMKILEGSMKVQGQMTLQVYGLYQGTGAVALNDGEMVLTADDTSYLQWRYETFHVGDIITLNTGCDSEALRNAQWATGGGSVLMENGSVTDSSTWNSAVSGSQPRTALGIKPDGSCVYMVVDGRQSGYSIGISYWQIINELKAQGCTDIINFDGGGSSAMALRLPGDSSTTVVNSPSGGAQRSCATYVVFVADTVKDGVPQHLYLKNANTYILAGSTVTLSSTATDTGYYPTALPSDVVYASTAGGGTLDGTNFTAPDATGDVIIGMTSESTGATGTGRLHIVQKPSELKIYKDGSEVSSYAKVDAGKSYKLSAAAYYCGNSVTADSDLYHYSMTKEFGTIDQDGNITISEDAIGTGYVTVTLGSASKTISLSTSAVFSDIVGNWAEAYITQLYKDGIVTGSGGMYYPSNNIKRGDFVLMLYRAAGKPAAPSDDGFADVASADYYASAIGWAAENGIAKGDGTNFSPEGSLTREDAFTFIYRYLSMSGDLSDYEDADVLSGYSDSSLVSSYAVTPTAVLMNKGLVNGNDGKILPQNSLTRAEMAKILSMSISQ